LRRASARRWSGRVGVYDLEGLGPVVRLSRIPRPLLAGDDADRNPAATPPQGVLPYDVDSRLTRAGAGNYRYVYTPDNRRSAIVDGVHVTLVVYEALGENVGEFRPDCRRPGMDECEDPSGCDAVPVTANEVVKPNRLGSVRDPHEEDYAGNAAGGGKFATYWRDTTNLDYADQRYYSATTGRFLTADPHAASGARPIRSRGTDIYIREVIQ
jgi:hypothetical protein